MTTEIDAEGLDPAYTDGPFFVVPMPVNKHGFGPEMDPAKVQHTSYEVWNVHNLSLGSYLTKELAQFVADALNASRSTSEAEPAALKAAAAISAERLASVASVTMSGDGSGSTMLRTLPTPASEAVPVRWPDLPAVKLANRGLNALYAEVPELVARDVSKLVLDAFAAIAADPLPTPASDDQVEAVRALVFDFQPSNDVPGPGHAREGRSLFNVIDWRGAYRGQINLTPEEAAALAAMGSTKP